MRGLKSYGPKRRFLVLLVAFFAESGTMARACNRTPDKKWIRNRHCRKTRGYKAVVNREARTLQIGSIRRDRLGVSWRKAVGVPPAAPLGYVPLRSLRMTLSIVPLYV